MAKRSRKRPSDIHKCYEVEWETDGEDVDLPQYMGVSKSYYDKVLDKLELIEKLDPYGITEMTNSACIDV